ncbi:putative rRNA methyltransferase YlbH [Peptoclostridium acidaminophilum DSM 3953]|uniref:Putative rRNA methyltransferase YlbH n=1 Tax=Peptoclostridium acidaminophilum DSM 3953 TaxID=1286171 RepID=W8TG02_PEPAC|nr:16S rRNA (guanine(966)-N(2))-methyltransferase RsmD [Peptoclostridium acidaminophilum]AHM56753.1 putative rRNA methyltransferase YlbH [Peptoclostridium acidaminophilum DSM 3953]
MRVVSGTARGTKLKSLEGLSTRPTLDRVKESIFNILNSDIDIYGSRVLDLFAGSGALGIEALSRGASRCVFVDKDAASIKIVKENLEKTRLVEKADVYMLEAGAAVSRLRGEKFDIVFLDPPYSRDMVPWILDAILSSDILSSKAVVVVEHEKTDEILNRYGSLAMYKTRQYGIVAVSFFELED